MPYSTYSMIGLMSGTSGDGLDVAFVNFKKEQTWQFDLEEAKTYPFPEGLASRLSRAHLLSALDLALLDVEFGQWMGEQVKAFCLEFEVKPRAVASHGHTVFHQPQQRLSLQIGNGWALYQASGEQVINDFRMRDIQLGGQGAPLVPMGDQLLFPQVDFCLNLGGISNISFEKGGKRVAFDISPFNLLFNAEAQKLGRPYDDRGEWARSGELHLPLLDELNCLDYYQKTGAKSLGREDMEHIFNPILEKSGLPSRDLLRTLTEHYAYQVAQVILENKVKEKPMILITGGGAYHTFFEERLSHYLKHSWEKYAASKELIEFKEALIFGFLGLLRLLGETNTLASVTGAEKDSSGGVIYS
ncbi:anhydro-N-acetylmuramic acid kinase [Algoriphagus confluentis]|uniref:Anhydro-N-acetylmuramic acid kinase n=1 Tax=Algoriphagus confluentis TaxID=1697556 RepID=A0ABQ6PQV1_9BACT|nr:anhydro-N-acetylmuramic acid kinase [Algoriphagus confluentis]